MSAIKERLFGAITVMSEEEAHALWLTISASHADWDEIEEVTPDEIDLQMLHEIDRNPDCKEFVSQEEALEILGMQ